MNLETKPLDPDEEAAQARQEALRAKQVERLDQLFRQAGDSQETRLIYQAVLDFQVSQRTAT